MPMKWLNGKNSNMGSIMKLVRICFFAFCATWATGATATLIHWQSFLDQSQEVPPTGVLTAVGAGPSTYDPSTFEWTWEVVVLGLTESADCSTPSQCAARYERPGRVLSRHFYDGDTQLFRYLYGPGLIG